jgi:hypothetical protein
MWGVRGDIDLLEGQGRQGVATNIAGKDPNELVNIVDYSAGGLCRDEIDSPDGFVVTCDSIDVVRITLTDEPVPRV